MTAAEKPGGLGSLAVGVLDRLRLVQDHVVELVVGEPRGVPPQRPVGGEEQIVVLDPRRRARVAGVVEHPQLGREARRLVHPVVDERSRHHRDRRARVPCLAGGAAAVEERQHHDGLAEAHVVGEAATESEPAQEREPAER